MLRFVRFWAILPVLLLAGCSAGGTGSNIGIRIDERRCEVRLSAVVQKTDAPRMAAFARATPALLGARGGDHADHFVFLTDASVVEVHDGLRRLGARSRVVYKKADVPAHKGIRPDNTPDDYMQGDPVQIFVEWHDGSQTRRLAYEDFFLEQTTGNPAVTVKPWTPHFVFHGSGVLNKASTGCIACTHDCPGGIIGNNQFPLVDPVPVLKADWSRLPAPGTRVTVVIRPVPSGGA